MNPKESVALAAKINQILDSLKAIFPAWPASLKTENDENSYKRELLKSLMQFHISRSEQLEKGFSIARGKAGDGERFLPSGSAFANWCTPTAEELGIDDFDRAFRKTIDRDWESLHPAFQHVAQSVRKIKSEFGGSIGRNDHEYEKRARFNISDMKRATDEQARKLFKPLYDEVVSRVKAGECFERIVQVEERKNPTGVKVRGRAAGNSALAALRASGL